MDQRIFAHRGASGYAPENTLEAFEKAVHMGAHGVELDVHICRSGELVVAHDERVERVSDGAGYIRDMTLKELKALRFNKIHPEYAHAQIPTLSEVFALLRRTELDINIELKNSWFDYENLERKVIETAAREFSLDRVIFSSFSHRSMQRVKQIDPKLYCGLLYEGSLVKPWVYALMLGMDAIHPDFTEVMTPGGECAAAHRAGIQVNTWTVNDRDIMETVLREGADILITNYPDVALDCLKQQEARA